MKGLDDIHLSGIFHTPDAISLLSHCKKAGIPTFSMKLDPPVLSKKKINKLSEKQIPPQISWSMNVAFIQNLPSYDYENATFCDFHYKYIVSIVSGDLRIIYKSL